MNVYEYCPKISDDRFLLRLVSKQDCDDLMRVYSDPKAVLLFNSDNCNGDDFYYKTSERMMQAIQMWLWSYDHGWFVRWSIIDKRTDCAVGTIELFRRASDDSYDGAGVLRLDLRSDYENEADIRQILSLILPPSFAWFGCDRIITKIKPAGKARERIFREMGFVSAGEPLIGHDGTEYRDYWIGWSR